MRLNVNFFSSLGSLVQRLWQERHYNEEYFADVAYRAMQELPPHLHVSVWDVVKEKPPAAVYEGRDFRIEVLFAAQGIPTIQQRGPGALHVLHGSSLHSLWHFAPATRLSARVLLGDASFERAELLQKGDSRPIAADAHLFHSLFDLERPTAHVVVRTTSEAERQPRYNLLPPGIAYDPHDEPSSLQNQLQLLDTLHASAKYSEYHALARHWLATEEAYPALQLLLAALRRIGDEEDRQILLHTAKLRHPELVAALLPALLREEAGDRILRVRQAVHIIDLRFFLALLRNIPQRAALFDLMARRYPAWEPVSTIIDWFRTLSALGILGFRLQEPALLILRGLLLDHSEQEIQAELRAQYANDPAASIETGVREIASALKHSWLLGPLIDTAGDSRAP
jgi:hypothetical protein